MKSKNIEVAMVETLSTEGRARAASLCRLDVELNVEALVTTPIFKDEEE